MTESDDQERLETEMMNRREKVVISVKGTDYRVKPRWTLNDMELYDESLEREKDPRRALTAVLHGQLEKAFKEESPAMEELWEAEEGILEKYISALVPENEDLCRFYTDTDEALPADQRFGIAYEQYRRELPGKIAEALQPLAEYRQQLLHSVAFDGIHNAIQSFSERMNELLTETVSGMVRMLQMTTDILKPLHQMTETMIRTVSQLSFPNATREEIECWEESCRKWGELGWPVLPEAPAGFFNHFPESEKEAHRLAMQYCSVAAMEELFGTLYRRKIKKSDLQAAIFCYRNKQYKPCALLLFGMLDAKLIRMQPKQQNRQVGLRAAEEFDKKMKEQAGGEQLLITLLYQINLVSCLCTYFAKGNNFKEEPAVINRNFLNHGMSTREVRKRDCIQLFIALNNLYEFTDAG